jgi:anhydro-N-acetylmuramic acid kinase
MSASDLAAVAAHGQTLFHDPPNTIQWLDPALIAAEVGCPVVSDFRRADLAAGGQGAPLVPFTDYVLFRHPAKNRVLLNIGGIANITYIPAGATLDQVIAFDTGPGNCISDHLCRKYDPHGPGYDAGGRRAVRGKPSEELIARVLANPFFAKSPPKSTDGPEMIAAFEGALRDLELQPYLTFEDLLATAAHVTARSILSQAQRLAERATIIASGGGCENDAIYQELLATNLLVKRIEEFGMPSEAKEAVAFAVLGAATLDGLPSNVPSATGAKRAVVLGSITPKP